MSEPTNEELEEIEWRNSPLPWKVIEDSPGYYRITNDAGDPREEYDVFESAEKSVLDFVVARCNAAVKADIIEPEKIAAWVIVSLEGKTVGLDSRRSYDWMERERLALPCPDEYRVVRVRVTVLPD